YIDGTSHNEAYTFYNWAGIDIFCYFSHHLITIPPLGWINVGHAHGVKIIASLLEFVKYFNVILHQAIPHAVLIWAFFDACDGIFTNYSWSERNVAESALVAGDRITDLYIGIDVWGRNFFGGGEFNTQEAVGVAHAHGCSLAIFAPAWTHEAMSREKTDANVVAMAEDLVSMSTDIDDCQLFLLRDRALWGSLWPFLNTRVPTALPFKTSFCRGLGVKRRMYGEVLCNAPWYNLRHQQYQPNSAHGPHGYLLSSSDDIQRDRNTDYLYKDGKGILRYRASFQRSRQELHSVNSKMITDNNMIADNEDNLNTIEDQKEYEKDLAEPEQSKHESPWKDTADDHEEEVELGRSDQNDGRGRSMMQMSVNLKLGSKGTRQRFGLACVPGERECLEVYQDDSFNGGSCLRINPSDNLDHAHRHTRLFHCDFYCKDTLIVCVVTKELSGFIEQFLNIELFMKDARNQDLKATLIGRSLSQPEAVKENSSGMVLVLPLEITSQPFREMQKYLLLNESAFYVPLENSFGWTV
ncbi:Cytosolic endo-beta-N-acetylglucosaminidase, partial [Operophtera brumata]